MGHMGFGDFETCAAIAADFPNAMFDCCFVINGTDPSPSISDEDAAAAIRKAGAERVMFGSDYPWFDPGARRRPHPEVAAVGRGEARGAVRERGAGVRAVAASGFF